MKALKLYRRRAGFSIDGLAEASAVSRGAIVRAENGDNSPSVRTLERMVAPLGISAGELLIAEDVLSRTAELEKALQAR